MSARHADDQELCRQRTGMVVGKLCDACEGRCPICDSRSNPSRPVKICDSCAGAERFAIFDSSDSSSSETTGNKSSFSSNNNKNNNNSENAILGDFSSTQHPAFNNPELLQTSVSRSLGQPAKAFAAQTTSVPARCIICNAVGKHVAYYCRACCLLEKDRDGCPKVKTMGARKALEHQRELLKRKQLMQQKKAREAVPGFS